MCHYLILIHPLFKSDSMALHIIDHPLVQHKLTLMRDKNYIHPDLGDAGDRIFGTK